MKKRIYLTEEHVNHLTEVVNHIREFEKEDYMDWNRDTNDENPTGHVYFHASKLAGLIRAWQLDAAPPASWEKDEWHHSYPPVDPCTSDVKEIERHRGLEIGEDGTVKGIFDLSN